ncbi:hypothetical protein ACWEN3_35645 [Streptomyces sp. NPDC004561]
MDQSLRTDSRCSRLREAPKHTEDSNAGYVVPRRICGQRVVPEADAAGGIDLAEATTDGPKMTQILRLEGSPLRESFGDAARLDEQASIEGCRPAPGRRGLPSRPRPHESRGGAGRRLGTVAKTVEGFGGFTKRYEQIEKVSVHHGNLWKVLLYRQIGRDRALMSDLAEKLQFTAASEDGRALDALAHARRNEAARGDCISPIGEDGGRIVISFATQNWQEAVVDRPRAAAFIRRCRIAVPAGAG